MGFELQAFIAARGVLREWRPRLKTAVVCTLGGDLALVPLTGALQKELLTRLPEPPPGAARTTARDEAAVRAWLAEASVTDPVVHVDAFEFGDDGHERYTLWRGGAPLWTGSELKVSVWFRTEMGLVPAPDFDIGRYRGESAAERWAQWLAEDA